VLYQEYQHSRCVVRRLGHGWFHHRARLHREGADQQTQIDVGRLCQSIGQRAFGLAQLDAGPLHYCGEHLLVDPIDREAGKQIDAAGEDRIDLAVQN
jgi:hypothetical protein